MPTTTAIQIGRRSKRSAWREPERGYRRLVMLCVALETNDLVHGRMIAHCFGRIFGDCDLVRNENVGKVSIAGD